MTHVADVLPPALVAAADANSPTVIAARQQEQACRTALMADVVRMADDERERFIKSTGDLMLRAYRLGDRENAVQLQAVMYAAIHARTPAQRQAMEAEIQRRIVDGVGYFTSDAAQELGRQGMGARV